MTYFVLSCTDCLQEQAPASTSTWTESHSGRPDGSRRRLDFDDSSSSSTPSSPLYVADVLHHHQHHQQQKGDQADVTDSTTIYRPWEVRYAR